MGALAKALFGWIAGNRGYLTLLAVAAAAAWLWVQFASVRADRDALAALAQQFCVAAGSELVPEGSKPAARGNDCRASIVRLARFERDANAATAQTLIDAMQARDRKQSADIDKAVSAAETARATALEMEKVNASIGPENRVGGDWFAALNRVAGLRAPAR